MAELGIIFDMDGVLVDSYAAHFESWRRLGSELGKEVTEEQFAATFGQTSHDVIGRLFGVRDEAEIKKLDHRKEAIYRDLIRGNIPQMPGAVELIKKLHAAGWRIAVGSSGPPENIDLICESMGLSPMLSAVVTGKDVSNGKPNPDVFLISAEKMNTAAERCVVVEDAPVGIEAAHRAGMTCVALAGSHEAGKLADADWVVQRLDEMSPERLKRLVEKN